MESFAFCTMPLLAFSHSLKIPHRLYLRRLLVPPNPGLFTAGRARCFGSLHPNRPREIFLISLAGSLLRTSSLGSPVNRGLACISSSTGSSGPNGGGNDGTGRWDGDGGGDGGFRGSSAQSFSIGEESVEASSRVPDVIILDVGGMTCGGCAASVKRILESQPQVSSASVNLATETAIVWAIPETKVMPNWKQQLGVRLAGNLTTCGFKSSFRDSDRVNVYKVFERKMDEKLQKLKQSGRELAVSWALCAVCLLGHVSHIFKAGPSWLQTCHSTSFHMSLSLFTFFGPGRKLVLDGFRSLFMGSPNMNTLVGLGALSSFAVSTIAALIPKLGWKTFFEEPIMLIAFVLLGKNLEQRAKIKATSDMTGLLNILPAKARLMIHTDAREVPSTVEVPCSDLHIGDQVVVLPGDRVPADGIVKAGRSTVDESSFTGEPLPVTKLPGVAGHFTYGVMALSAATFAFWSLFGSQLVPAALIQGSVVSLALQLSCSVLVVACPCALGLATPTAVLVGTSLGATRGLLLRGGDVLEKFAAVDTIVFDKTGTLTIGKPVVTRVMPSLFDEHEHSKENSDFKWTEADILRLAAGVESNTNHPIGKAIVEAAHSIGCENVKAKDGTFTEEPGSGAVAIIEKMKVSVGTLSWVRRHGVHGNQFPDVESQNQSVVYVGVDNALAGVIYFEDKVREDAQLVVETLAKQGINIYMLSGDKKNAAEYVASMIGIDKRKVLYEVKPEEKKRFISELQKEKQIVAMVGDGINDAAALASADVGIAMGEGVGAASDVSSVVLLGNRLSQLIDALDLSKSTMKTVKQNLWWAFAYNIVGIPVAAGVLLPSTGTILTPSIAGGLMGLSSVGVMMNSLLLRFKVEQNKKVDTDSKESRGSSDFLVQIQNQKQNPYPVK
ncbi:copper-transporting ATPase PAA1, chloroplastic-like isoform X2 [Zingiber officinale]|uniref:copper-transporting ATPase PAA1, chloroplastic-like isoform X2 n=1 Tax=Zingiber officinale TaxID=94328 RepID=UPI001C4A9414|nr:copper-transporting ATPase PAA1, chloroplastic-like isoform X2 [Zingiber officinale]